MLTFTLVLSGHLVPGYQSPTDGRLASVRSTAASRACGTALHSFFILSCCIGPSLGMFSNRFNQKANHLQSGVPRQQFYFQSGD